MFVHVYRVGEKDDAGFHQETSRVTMVEDAESFGVPGSYSPKALVLGTRPNLSVIPMVEIRWYWVEES